MTPSVETVQYRRGGCRGRRIGVNLGRRSSYRREKSVQTTGTGSFCNHAEIAHRSKQTGKSISRTHARSSDGAIASSATAAYLHGTRRSGPLKYTPGFLYILVLFIAGKFIFADPRATLVQWGEYHLSWVEVLMVGAAMMAMAEQLRVS